MKYIPLIPIITLFLASCDRPKQPDALHDQNTTENLEIALDYTPEMVGPGIISRSSFEGHASITPNGDEIYFAVYSNDHGYSTIAYSAKKENKWSEPEIVSFSGRYSDGSPALSPDGKTLYFSSRRPINGDVINTSNDLWYAKRNVDSKWAAPQRLKGKINTPYNEFSPSVDQKGNLYFCSNRPDGYGDMDIYYAEYIDGKYGDPILLNDSVNSQYHEGNVGISPDGKVLYLMVQHKPGDLGYDDIHYAVMKGDTWSKAKNIGPIVNTPTYDFSPKISPDGKILYFSSRINRDYNAPHIAYTYNSFQKHLNSPLNGLGNIYRVELSSLNLELDE
ncbi:hypothetical protein FNH22_04950 [Fulvivirga sp. M361]|uniref:PD40 domain-containing protein n=1 Tax=Fulvivirga sp. M361 TaxID=2594266 RepID=UPI001179ED42|nr:PD40 domain-containing protein [Fulvivirga sp. M361]TRX61406.1 hypothetical protein FNH22_04950 [Fulvivirga sp. M361]